MNSMKRTRVSALLSVTGGGGGMGCKLRLLRAGWFGLQLLED